MEPEKKGKKISVEISKDLEGGVYFNQALIIHTNKEFVIDLGFALPDGRIKVQSRIITNPVDAKAFLNAFQENLATFERQYGTIRSPQAIAFPNENKKIH